MRDSSSADSFRDSNSTSSLNSALPNRKPDASAPTTDNEENTSEGAGSLPTDTVLTSTLLKGAQEAVALVGQLDSSATSPALSTASQAVPLAKSALEALNLPAARVHEDIPGLDSHPRAGQALLDFATTSPMQLFSPSRPTPFADGLAEQAAALLGLRDNARLLRLLTPLAAEQTLLIDAIEGQGALSHVEEYRLRLLSENQAIPHKEVMSKNASVAIRLGDGNEYTINGYITRFGLEQIDGKLAVYEARLVPWLWFLGKRVNSRIYQHVTAEDVLRQVFSDYGALADFEFRLSNALQEETFLVQYNETDLHFVSRLMERYGLFYYVAHRPDGHTLIIGDDSRLEDTCPTQIHHPRIRHRTAGAVKDTDDLLRLSSARELQPGTVALNTFNFKRPSVPPYVQEDTLANQGEVPRLEVYDGNPAYAYRDSDQGTSEARRRLEVFEWQAKQFQAQTECRGMAVGTTFQILDHPALRGSNTQDREFLVVGMRLSARNNYRDAGPGNQTEPVYENQLTLIRRKVPYRPVPRHAKPVMKGPQTAIVVGPEGQEIHTDEFGRIKVQFPWDREGRNDQSSSCWVRVSQPWAGRGWGTVAIPRINQEVVVDFLEGDPDRPMVMGRAFNGEQRPPTGLPDSAHVMGFISRSTPGGGGFCEMTIHDQAGSELINIHSQKDMCTTVQNDMFTVVNGPAQTNIVSSGEQVNRVKKSIFNQSETENITSVAHTNLSLVAETDYLSAQAEKALTLKSVTDLIAAIAKTAVVVNAEDDGIYLKAATNIVLEVGSSSITLTKDGTILINGKLVQITGTDSVDLNP